MTTPGSLFGQKVIGVTVYDVVSAIGEKLAVNVLQSPTEQIGLGICPVVKSTPETVAQPFLEILINILPVKVNVHAGVVVVTFVNVKVVLVLRRGVKKLPAPAASKTIL